MKNVLAVLGLVFAAVSFQASAATLEWASQSAPGPTSSVNKDDSNPMLITADVTFDGNSGPLTHKWTYSLDAAAVIKNIAIEFYDSQMSVSSVKLVGSSSTINLASNAVALITGDVIRSWTYTGLLQAGNYDLVLNIASVTDGAQYDVKVAQTPVPAAVWLFGSALAGLMGAKRRKAA